MVKARQKRRFGPWMNSLSIMIVVAAMLWSTPLCAQEPDPAETTEDLPVVEGMEGLEPVGPVDVVKPLGKHIVMDLTPRVGDSRSYQCRIDTQNTIAGKMQTVVATFDVDTEVVEQTDAGFKVAVTVGAGAVTKSNAKTKEIKPSTCVFETDSLGFPTQLEVNDKLFDIGQDHLLRKIFEAQKLKVGNGWRESYVLKHADLLPAGIPVQTLVRVQQHKEVNGQKLAVLLVRTTGRAEPEAGDLKLLEVAGNGYLIVAYEERRIVEYTQNLNIGSIDKDEKTNSITSTFTLKSLAPVVAEPADEPPEPEAAGGLLNGESAGPGGSAPLTSGVALLGIAICGLLFAAGYRPRTHFAVSIRRAALCAARALLVLVLSFSLAGGQASADFCVSKALLAVGIKATPVAVQAYTVWNLGGLAPGSNMNDLLAAVIPGGGGAAAENWITEDRELTSQSIPAGLMGAPLLAAAIPAPPPLPPALTAQIAKSYATARSIGGAAVIVAAGLGIAYGCGGCFRGGGHGRKWPPGEVLATEVGADERFDGQDPYEAVDEEIISAAGSIPAGATVTGVVVTLEHKAWEEGDTFQVDYAGSTIFDSGVVTNDTYVIVIVPALGSSDQVTVRVIANASETTDWKWNASVDFYGTLP